MFTEILKATNPLLDDVRHWRTPAGTEIDFVVGRRGTLIAVEVKAGPLRGRVPRACRSFVEAYAPGYLILVGGDEAPETRLGKTRVAFVTPVDFPAKLSEALARVS